MVGQDTIRNIKQVREQLGCTLTEAKDWVTRNQDKTVDEIVKMVREGSPSSYYHKYAFEIERQSGKVEMHNTFATSVKMAWGNVGAYIKHDTNEDDPVVNVGWSSTQ